MRLIFLFKNPMNLTDEQWLLIQPLLQPLLQPLRPAPARGPGRPAVPLRAALDGILWKIRTHAPWYDLPPEYPSHATCYRYYRRLTRLGLLAPIFQALLHDLQARGGIDLLAALQRRDLIVLTLRRRHFVIINPDLPHTWQLSTAQLFVRLSLDIIARAGPAPIHDPWSLIAASPLSWLDSY
ncbi:MAG: transposase [Chloroflexota bacterium]